MRTKGYRSRGVVLVSVMFLAVLIAMYITSSAILSKGQYGSLRQSADDRRAEEAARSGLEYAQARLEENPKWRGDGQGVIVDTQTLTVKEEDGNVVGVVTTSDGGRAQFRIRFSHQNGGGNPEGVADPSEAMWIDSPHVSVNNILNFYPTSLPLGDGENYSCRGNTTSYPVPPFSAAIVSEGRVFDELSEVDRDSPNPSASRLESVRVLEAFYRVSDFSGKTPVLDAVGMAGGDVDIRLLPHSKAQQRVGMSNLLESGPTSFRSRGDVSITDVNKSASLLAGDDTDLLMPGNKNLLAVLGTNVRRGQEDANGDFYKITWDEAGSVSADASELKAGVYVYWASDEKLHYYDLGFKDYVAEMRKNPSNPGQVVNLDQKGVAFVKAGTAGPDKVTSDKHRFVITEDVVVQPAGGVKDLTIMPRAGAKEDLGNNTDSGGGNSGGELDGDDDEVLKSFVSNPANLSREKDGPLHKVLLSLAKVGSFNYNNLDWVSIGDGSLGSGSVNWDESEVIFNGSVNGQAAGVFTSLLSGLVKVDTSQADENYLSLIQDQTYTVKPEALSMILGGGGSSMEEIDLGPAQSAEPLGAGDFEVTLAPQGESAARLLVPGDVRITADVKGAAGSITAKGEIRLVGVGIDLDAGQGGEGTGVSLYSAKNITLSTLRKDQNRQEYEFAGVDLRGVLYSWGDINIKTSSKDDTLGDPKRFFLQGSMIAYGGEPGVHSPGKRGGDIKIRSHQVDLIFDPAYLLGLNSDKDTKVTLSVLSQSYRQ